jgi:hypothetical protein
VVPAYVWPRIEPTDGILILFRPIDLRASERAAPLNEIRLLVVGNTEALVERAWEATADDGIGRRPGTAHHGH